MMISVFGRKRDSRSLKTFLSNFYKKVFKGVEEKMGYQGVVVLAGLLIYAGFNPLAAAEMSSTVTSEVQMEPVIVVEEATSVISTSHTGIGEIEITANFSVEANTKQVDMFVETTTFYYNGDPAAIEVSPIPLLESSGVEIDANSAVLMGGTNPASYVGDGDPIEDYPSRKTETLTFESDDMVFNHSTDVTVTWDQNEPLKPAGQYYAKVKLTCLTVFP